MDRIDAMKVFVTALDEGSLVGAARKLGRSPAAVSRAIVLLENHVGAPLLHRTTRVIRLSEAGERYAAACRRALVDLEEADMLVADEKSAPRGVLSVTAPVFGGEVILRPIIEAFMDAYPEIGVRLNLFDRPVNLIEEGHDVALRFAAVQDSTLTAEKVGEISRVVVAAPAYLDSGPPIIEPADLADHWIIAMARFGVDSWSFPGAPLPRTVAIQPRLVVNSARAAIASAVEGRGVTRLSSHHVAAELKAGALRRVLEKDEPPPLPVNLVTPHGRQAIPKVRAFADFVVPRLRAAFEGLAD